MGCKSLNFIWIGIGFFVAASPAGAGFGSDANGGWADTPQGKFECRTERGSDYNQLVLLAGKVLYRGYTPDVAEDGPITAGIAGGNGAGTGCFDAVDYRDGYLLVLRTLQPPWYGVYNYAVIDFNVDPPTILELVDTDESAPKSSPVIWQPDGFLLHYHGVTIDEDMDEVKKRASHEVWFDFTKKEVSQRK